MSDADLIQSDARRAERREARAPSTLRADGVAPLDVVVLDISATGIRIVTSAELGVGQEISIGLAGAGTTRAFVAWRRGDEYGCAFGKPLTPDDEARAFASTAPIALGRPTGPAADAPRVSTDNLQELYLHHKLWALPADAIAAGVLMLGGAIAAAWMLFPR